MNKEQLDPEQLAFSKAPIDNPENPAYPNHTDTDIWVSGFKAGFEEAHRLKSAEEIIEKHVGRKYWAEWRYWQKEAVLNAVREYHNQFTAEQLKGKINDIL